MSEKISEKSLENVQKKGRRKVQYWYHVHLQRGPLTSDLQICECKWVLWVPTSLPFTDMPTL